MASPRQTVRITRAVEPFVMVPHDRPDFVERPQIAAQLIADGRVFFHLLVFVRRSADRV